MASVNAVHLIGNLTRQPEVKYTPKGTAVCDIGLAINRNYSTDSGEKREEVTFVDVTLFGRTAEVVGEYCSKGSPLYVFGRLVLDVWDDKATGQKRSKLKVVGENVQLLSGKDDARGGAGGGRSYAHTEGGESRTAPPPRRPAPQQKPQDPDLDQPEDDIPF